MIKKEQPFANAKYLRLELTKEGLKNIDKETDSPSLQDAVMYMLELGNGVQIPRHEHPSPKHFATALEELIQEHCLEAGEKIDGNVSDEINKLISQGYARFLDV